MIQYFYEKNDLVTAPEKNIIVDEDIFQRGLCLPSDNKMTAEEQDKVIEIVRSCFH